MLRLKNPVHPGRFVRTEVINARAALSADMAIRVQKAFGPDMETLMRMQNSWDIAQARQREPAIKVKRYVAKASRAERGTAAE